MRWWKCVEDRSGKTENTPSRKTNDCGRFFANNKNDSTREERELRGEKKRRRGKGRDWRSEDFMKTFSNTHDTPKRRKQTAGRESGADVTRKGEREMRMRRR